MPEQLAGEARLLFGERVRAVFREPQRRFRSAEPLVGRDIKLGQHTFDGQLREIDGTAGPDRGRSFGRGRRHRHLPSEPGQITRRDVLHRSRVRSSLQFYKKMTAPGYRALIEIINIFRHDSGRRPERRTVFIRNVGKPRPGASLRQ
jgi:hypothetical protein